MACEDDALEARRIRKVQAYSHDTEMIFLLPSLQLQLKTIHNQSQHEPKADGTLTYNCQCLFISVVAIEILSDENIQPSMSLYLGNSNRKILKRGNV